MKRKSCLYLFLSLCLYYFTYGQDTVRIRNTKDYQPNKINLLVSPSGKTTVIKILDRSENWEITPETEMGDDGLPSPEAGGNKMVDPNLTPEQKARIRQNECINFRFAGLSRSKVKTSIAPNNGATFNSLPQFLNSLFPDDDMKAVVRALPKPYAQRAIQEDKVVSVKNLFLLAYAREKDNDYHLILTNSERTKFFNAELSGLPANAANSFQTLKSARTAFENFPGAVKCGKYTFLQTPLKILFIKGALFFDVDHPAGQVGPLGARPATAWEIHPVTQIKFE
jgi:hypothetical protein